MVVTNQMIQVAGHALHCTIMDPASGEIPRAVCLFFHGQGDYSSRYITVLQPFTRRSIRCIAFDLTGHGHSPGKRGHISNVSLIDAVIREGIAMAGDLPHGIAGHSMGGLLALRHLTLVLQENLPTPRFCWVNSALLSPAYNKPNWYVAIAQFLAQFFPSLMVKTGATPDLCRTPVEGKQVVRDPQHLGHQCISIGWGSELIKIANFIRKNLPPMSSDIPFLYTQGESDLICPAHLADAFFSNLKLTNKTYQQFPNMRHETFLEPNNALLFNALDEWLDTHLTQIYHLP